MRYLHYALVSTFGLAYLVGYGQEAFDRKSPALMSVGLLVGLILLRNFEWKRITLRWSQVCLAERIWLAIAVAPVLFHSARFLVLLWGQ